MGINGVLSSAPRFTAPEAVCSHLLPKRGPRALEQLAAERAAIARVVARSGSARFHAHFTEQVQAGAAIRRSLAFPSHRSPLASDDRRACSSPIKLATRELGGRGLR